MQPERVVNFMVPWIFDDLNLGSLKIYFLGIGEVELHPFFDYSPTYFDGIVPVAFRFRSFTQLITGETAWMLLSVHLNPL